MLTAQGLGLRRNGSWLWRDLDIALAAGDGVWLQGRNGAGKSSLLRALAGLLPPHRGRVQRTVPLHYCAHRDAVEDGWNVRAHLASWCRVQGVAVDAAALDARLHDLGLRGDTPTARLSQGQRRQLALSRLLLAPRPLWLLDEPAAALDGDALGWLERRCHDHLRNGGALLLVSHQPLMLPALRPLHLDAVHRG